ncbi:MAG TPA: MlaD family protein [Cyclobacteriaceae bacterium]|nr:MlaD family protein [Cyclobacteriaceae bacterium]
MKNKELKVGLFVALALVLLYFGVDFLKGKDFFERSHKYYAIYDNVDQLQKANPVLVNGFAVGRVSNISIMQKKQNKVLVELDIDSDIVLGDSTRAILDSEFIGGKYILLSIGNVVTPKEPNDTIIAEVAKSVLQTISSTAEPVADNLQTTIRKLNTVLDNLSSNSQSLDTIFRKLRATPEKLNNTLTNSSAKLDELTLTIKTTTEHLNQTLVELKPTVKNFQVFSDSLKRIELNKTLGKTQATMTKLNETLAQLGKKDNTAGRLLTEDSLYVNLNKLLQSLDTLAANFNDNPSHFLSPLGKSKKKIERERKAAAAARNKK